MTQGRIDAGGGAGVIGLLGGAVLAAQRVVEPVQGPVVAPGVGDIAHVGLARPTPARLLGEIGPIRAHGSSVRSLG